MHLYHHHNLVMLVFKWNSHHLNMVDPHARKDHANHLSQHDHHNQHAICDILIFIALSTFMRAKTTLESSSLLMLGTAWGTEKNLSEAWVQEPCHFAIRPGFPIGNHLGYPSYFCGVQVFYGSPLTFVPCSSQWGRPLAIRTRRESSATLAANKEDIARENILEWRKDLSLFMGEELRMIKVFGHLCSRNHQLCSLFAMGAPETIPRVKWTDSLYWDSQLISFLASDTWTNVNDRAF